MFSPPQLDCIGMWHIYHNRRMGKVKEDNLRRDKSLSKSHIRNNTDWPQFDVHLQSLKDINRLTYLHLTLKARLIREIRGN